MLALALPRNVKELHRFLGMVQYYRDLWDRCSKMLAPLTSLVGECSQTKVTKPKEAKRSLGTGLKSIKKHSMM
jgi:hypothetical protein